MYDFFLHLFILFKIQKNMYCIFVILDEHIGIELKNIISTFFIIALVSVFDWEPGSWCYLPNSPSFSSGINQYLLLGIYRDRFIRVSFWDHFFQYGLEYWLKYYLQIAGGVLTALILFFARANPVSCLW